MAQQLLCQPKLLIALSLALHGGCLAPIDLDCAEPRRSPSSVAETPMLEDLQIPVEDFIADLEVTRDAQLIAGDKNGRIPEGQPRLDGPLSIEIQLSYGREGEIITPESDPICGPAYLSLPVELTVVHDGDVLLTAIGNGPIGWQIDGSPRAELVAEYQPQLWELLQVEPPDEERPVASMFVFYRDSTADAIDIDLSHCDGPRLDCPPDFAHIEWGET